MANNNWDYFKDWAVGRKNEEYIPFINDKRNDFNYRALGREINIAETGIRQNKKCRDYLENVQCELIALGQMVPKPSINRHHLADIGVPLRVKNGELSNIERNDYERLKEEVVRLSEENRFLKTEFKRFAKMEEFLAEFGVLPR